MTESSPYQAVVFAGGGCRCVWQLGFWEIAAPALDLRPRVVGAVSAGAAMACLVFAGRIRATLDSFTRRVAANQHNAYPLNALRRQPIFPHERMYRETILEHLDEAALERLHRGPDIRVLLARTPIWLGPRTGVLVGFLAYQAETLLASRVHAQFACRAGFVPEVVSVRACTTAEEVADLILHSSCTPPLTRAYRRGGRPVLDGAIIDNVPVDAIASSPERTLVLLTHPHPQHAIPRIPGRTYVQPSKPVPIEKWDYTNPRGVGAAYDLGRRDAERFMRAAGRAAS